MKSEIPLFPLSLVMFPSAIYPLHIFEERYKAMIKKCVHNNEGFGIVSFIDKEISDVGCYVVVKSIMKTYPNGSQDILVEGKERFRTMETFYHLDEYMVGRVLPFSDRDNDNMDKDLVNSALDKFGEILDKTNIILDNSYWKKLETTRNKSYKIAEKSGLDLKQQQRLLSMDSESGRLQFLLKHLLKMESILEKTTWEKNIISGDGYLN